ncbi:MAG: late competence development ComFB family protein [Pseudanabaena sp.]
MSSFKNVLEEFVVSEVNNQLDLLNAPVREGINIADVAAFSLNRLPVLYANTNRGWVQQRLRAKHEFKHQIIVAVRHGLLGIRRQSLRQLVSLFPPDLDNPACVLMRLQKLFHNPSLRWQQVPHTFEVALSSDVLAPDFVGLSISDRFRVRDVKAYLQRKGSSHHRGRVNNNLGCPSKLPHPNLDSYLLFASNPAINVLEDLTIQEVKSQLDNMGARLPRHVGFDDVCAYVLNRLPAMYATTKQGLLWQLQKVELSLLSQLKSLVMQALLALGNTPCRFAEPIPLVGFELECAQAISELRLLFLRDDISWRNIADLAEYALYHHQRGLTFWRHQWRLLGQVYSELFTSPEEAELSLSPSPDGEVLIVRTLSKQAFGRVADNPKLLASTTLRFFPAISAISLSAGFLKFPINYSRQEMLADVFL